MQASGACLNLIRVSEGYSLTPYLDAASIWTVGIGHKLGDMEAVRMWTPDEVERAFAEDVAIAERGVERVCFGLNLTQGQFDALVDFVFNLGPEDLAGSTLLRLLKAGDIAGAADQFLRWDKAHVSGQVVEISGLLRRRQAEKRLFLSGLLPQSA